LLEPLTPIVSAWIEKDKDRPAFSVDHQDVYNATLTTFDGYQYLIGPEILAVEFRHRLRVRPQSAGPPTAELLSKPAPYSELLVETTNRLLDMVRLTMTGEQRKLLRIGVVSTTLVSEGDVPPGIVRFLKRVAKPWNTSLDAFSVDVTTKLPKVKSTARYDRCIHQFTKPEDNEGLVTIKLDWQRLFDEEKRLSITVLPALLASAKNDALDYFEDIGEGGRFDE